MVLESIIKGQLGPSLPSSFLQKESSRGSHRLRRPLQGAFMFLNLSSGIGMAQDSGTMPPNLLVGSFLGFALLFTLLQGNLQSVWNTRKFLQLAFIHAY